MDNVDRRGMQETTTDQPIKLRFDFDFERTSPSTALIEALASVNDTDPIALLEGEDFSVGEYVDLDALDRLMTDGRETDVESITLSIDGYAVQITDDEVVIRPAAADA